jgi:N utilization substance protein A
LVVLSNDELKCISLFESITGASPEDCILEPDRIIFIVKEGDMGRAIGKKGAAIARVRGTFGKQVDAFENAETPEGFVRKMFPGVELRELKIVEHGGAKTVQFTVAAKDRGAVIGRNGERIKLARAVLERRHGAGLKLV